MKAFLRPVEVLWYFAGFLVFFCADWVCAVSDPDLRGNIYLCSQAFLTLPTKLLSIVTHLYYFMIAFLENQGKVSLMQ